MPGDCRSQTTDMQIRRATSDDTDRIRSLYVAAFPEGEGETVASLAADLLAEATTPETFSLVAESDAMIVGHIAFSPVSDAHADRFSGYILAPLAVSPNFQKQRIATRLIEQGIEQLLKLGVDIVFVYGDPGFYGRFEFQLGHAAEYIPPYELQFPFGWLARPLSDVDSFASSGNLSCVSSLRRADIW